MVLKIEIREVQYNDKPFIIPMTHFDLQVEETEYNVRVYKNIGMNEGNRLFELSTALKEFIKDFYHNKSYPNPSFSESDKKES